ncbi:MAG: hypothetical protein HDS78_03310 [Bacteroidales bacterium]|nr:hypothetical protein [Bacteroidales bacterium]
MSDVKNVIQSVADKWFLSEPLLFAAFCGHTVTENRNMQCAMRSGQRRIEYNPDWLRGLRELEVMELLRHEVIRIILKHPYDRQPVSPDAELLYKASNLTIYMHGGSSIPPQVDFSTLKLDKKLSFEEYYNQLLHQKPPKTQSTNGEGDAMEPSSGDSDIDGLGSSKSGSSDNDSESGADSTTKGDGNLTAEALTGVGANSSSGVEQMPVSLRDIHDNGFDATGLWEEDAVQIEYINSCIENAMLSRQWGTLPGNIQDLIKASTIKADNIRRRLDMFRTSIISTSRRLTRMRPSRRYGWAQMGVLHPYTSKLLIAVDTSGSVRQEDLIRFFGVINSFFTYGIPFIDVIQFDTKIHLPLLSLKKVTSKIQLRGRGDTNFQAPVDYFDEHKEYDGMIVFTDGYAPTPTMPVNRKILWVLQDIECYKDCELTPKVYI